jgi:hypothetical protein
MIKVFFPILKIHLFIEMTHCPFYHKGGREKLKKGVLIKKWDPVQSPIFTKYNEG